MVYTCLAALRPRGQSLWQGIALGTVDEVVALLDACLAMDLRIQTSSGQHYREIAERTPRVSYKWLLRCARRHGIRSRKCHRTTAEQQLAIAAVESGGMNIRAAAAATGVSRSAVHRLVKSRRDAMVAAVDDVGFAYVAVYRCPEHGKITISPCPACTAVAARRTALAS